MIFSEEEMKIRKFGKLRMKDPKEITSGSHKKEIWICDCGRKKSINIISVISGCAIKCGRCNEISEEEMKIRKFGKLRMKDPKAVLPGSAKKGIWICDCGKETEKQINHIISGQTTSCGRCNEISAEEMKIRKFGKLRMQDPKEITSGSEKKELFICDCGRETEKQVHNVISGNTTSCGRCNEISAKEMETRKFGKLRMKDSKTILAGSGKKEVWICDCGKETTTKIEYVTIGHTTSCGKCSDSVYEWYLKNKEMVKFLKCPIQPENFPLGGPVPLEIIKTVIAPFKCQCVLCRKIYYPRLCDIKLNNGGLTCGCSSYRISSAQRDISLFIESLGFSTELEYSVNKLKYDIHISSSNLLIEYDGTHWHAMEGAKERDLRKEENAIAFGYEFFRITEDEWLKNRKRIENQLKQVLT